jgi:hypothetical protein
MFINGPLATASTAVTGAIRNAARATGASFEYLLATARVESGLNPKAAAKTSSARGLFQFIDRTWLSTLKQAGPSLGYGRFADAITPTANGRFEVTDPAMRQQISALRDDPSANAAMAGAFTRDNANRLANVLGRPATEGELYMAHFLGANGAGRLISLATSNPKTSAASVFPKAAAANPSIFYDGSGNARSAGGVYTELTRRFDVARAGNAPAVAAMQAPFGAAAPTAQGVVQPVAANAPVGPATRSLFSDLSGGAQRREPVSQIVRELWSSRPHVAAALTGGTSPTSGKGASAVAPAATNEGLHGLYRDLPPSVRGLFTTRS